MLSDDNLIENTDQKELIWVANYAEQNGVDCLNASLLDLGCGNGINTLALSHHFNIVYGIEPNELLLKESRNNKRKISKLTPNWPGLSKLRFYKGSFLEIPLKKIDIVSLFDSLNFSSNPYLALDNVFYHLKPGGLVFISEPHEKSEFSNDILDDSDALKKKLDNLKLTRKSIKKYIKQNKIETIINRETPIEYFLILRKSL
ncbi:Methyltransferase domain [seawater metagenome]|uniref:Methyltransferase domain n=1 Tax=seawater metagenome TaxID=1561972 RepID=A0A5E8CK18_9ZZZZ